MTKRHYFQSAVIFLAAGYFVDQTLHLHWFETLLLMLIMIVCVFHTMDVRDDITKKMAEKHALKRRSTDNGEGTVES